MKRFTITLTLLIALLALTGAAFAEQVDPLFDKWFAYGISDSLGNIKEAFADGSVALNGKSIPAGAKIDSCPVSSYIADYLSFLGVAMPCSAEDLLVNFPIPKGSPVWTSGILGDVDYHYGSSTVRLKDSCLLGITETYEGYSGDNILEFYEFEITTDSKTYNLVVGSMNGPDLWCGLLPGSAEIDNPIGSLDIIGHAEITNCEEWVSLRADADKTSPRIKKVFLGSNVLAYTTVGDFTACNVDGVDGWILSSYLTPTNEMLYEYEQQYLRKHPWRG